jgi:mevalonate kinase
MLEFWSPGKLLISGEYAVLNGSKALAIPTKLGQSMRIEERDDKNIVWQSLSKSGKIWFQALIDVDKGKLLSSSSEIIGQQLLAALDFCKSQRPEHFYKTGFNIETKLDFARNWGLGSSSTFISNLSHWTGVDGLAILWNGYNGSGYDVVVGKERHALMYQMESLNPNKAIWELCDFAPIFSDWIYFVHLGRKQDSNKAIDGLRENAFSACVMEDFSAISEEMLHCTDLEEFQLLMRTHEKMLSAILGMVRVKEKLFFDYPYEVKSLGAWGGDFVMAIGQESDMQYFKNKGYHDVVSFSEMVLESQKK